MRRAFIAAMATAILFVAPAAAADDPGKFTDAFLERVIAKYPERMAHRDPSEPLVIAYTSASGEDAFINLHRVFGFCANAKPDDCQRVTDEFFENIFQPLPVVRAQNLRIIVRDAQYLASIEAMERKSKPFATMAFREPIGDDLFAILAVDSPKTTALASQSTLTELKLSRDAAWALARAQTKGNLPPMPDPAQIAKSGVALQDFEYLASLLADREGWAKISATVGPDLIVTAVSDGFVLATRMESGPRLESFRKTVAEDCAAQPRCISPNIYRFRDGRWVVAQ